MKRSKQTLLGATCCNRTLRYSISKTLHEHSNLDFTQMDTEKVTKVRERLNQRSETLLGSFHDGNEAIREICGECHSQGGFPLEVAWQ